MRIVDLAVLAVLDAPEHFVFRDRLDSFASVNAVEVVCLPRILRLLVPFQSLGLQLYRYPRHHLGRASYRPSSSHSSASAAVVLGFDQADCQSKRY